MKKNIKILLLTITCCSVLHAQDHLRLWYEKPANTWVEALPLGNGYIGAMVYGKVEDELIQLNEGTLWAGTPCAKSVNPDAYSYLSEMREALSRDDFAAAGTLSKKCKAISPKVFFLWEILKSSSLLVIGRLGIWDISVSWI